MQLYSYIPWIVSYGILVARAILECSRIPAQSFFHWICMVNEKLMN